MQTNIDADAILHKIALSPQCSRPEGVELTHSCTPSAAASTPRPARPMCSDRQANIYAWTTQKRSLTSLHLAARTDCSESIAVKAPLPSPPRSGWRQLAGRTGAELTLSERQPAPPSLPPSLVVSWPGYVPRSPHGAYRCVFGTLGPGAAYLEPIVTASAPLGCHLPARRKRWLSANQMSRFTNISQSPPRFNSK